MLNVLSAITLPFIGEVSLSASLTIVFCICLLAVVGFEFVNGFHDTANAVATVIYTKALKPVYAIPWSGFFNFLGVFLGGVAVAMGILKLLPLDDLMKLPVAVGACMVLAVLLASIVWNLGTWYLGIPCSSSHTLIGAMIGASIAFTWYYGGVGVNWDKAKEIGLSLILSPLIGFGAAALLMYFLKHVVKSKALFHIPQGENDTPPILVRILLIITCTLVSFFHGSNDGQKGVGLLMLILIAFVPVKFAVNHSISNDKILLSLNKTEQVITRNVASAADAAHGLLIHLDSAVTQTKVQLVSKNPADTAKTYKFRKEVKSVVKGIDAVLADKNGKFTKEDVAVLKSASKDLNGLTDFAPIWVIATISISLGIGTMVGWKRIVVTIGEKIGNEHLNYAQGATSEIIAASTIGLSTAFGLPVSTTHVLSSGIAGSMMASGGAGNLNSKTLKNIALAWVLTLPVAIILSLLLFMFFHLFI
ncbi:inorganic phosphate transporter [Mucilaginibacter sp. BJC16-A38]|uniref:inorganic phosphate transporter n=1 Tax=Mucilaginibacter phenanthrenivorans TaxID=1234842 RepID=UPI00215814CA|nr:inorganic phosphate transporter [Mucilaginibacter phenanthrenivorans]MCR8560009.1 inorganic phosphate transporter [Mucilaginibacter phenanthrenivorans]